MIKSSKIIISGAAGLVGQNLVLLIRKLGYANVVAIDKHERNLAVLARMNPGVRTKVADLAEPDDWQEEFVSADCVVQLHAQVTSKFPEEFVRNNVTATEHVISAMRRYDVGFLIHVSSSVVNSMADDDYTRTKRKQEELVAKSGIPHCVLRPPLMFGWFDPKHLGWLARFMKKVPVFPVPGDGRYLRQPLYNRDFCRVIEWCIRFRPDRAIYDIVGQEDVYYVDIIKTIKRELRLRTVILPIPYRLFEMLLRLYAVFSDQPPFVVDQLKALAAGDHFRGIDMEATFGIRPTPFVEAIRETFCDGTYSRVILERT